MIENQAKTVIVIAGQDNRPDKWLKRSVHNQRKKRVIN